MWLPISSGGAHVPWKDESCYSCDVSGGVHAGLWEFMLACGRVLGGVCHVVSNINHLSVVVCGPGCPLEPKLYCCVCDVGGVYRAIFLAQFRLRLCADPRVKGPTSIS